MVQCKIIKTPSLENNTLRCKICDTTYRNTGQKTTWKEYQTCKVCLYLIEIFMWNGNRLNVYFDID